MYMNIVGSMLIYLNETQPESIGIDLHVLGPGMRTLLFGAQIPTR